MGKGFLAAAVACVFSLVAVSPAIAGPHYSKTVSVVEIAVSNCYFFKLTGVAEADPVVANSPWFAIAKTHPNAKELYALLLSVRSSGSTLERVVTTGAVVCGHAEVSTIDF